jgi:hypothetical protein
MIWVPNPKKDRNIQRQYDDSTTILFDQDKKDTFSMKFKYDGMGNLAAYKENKVDRK